MKFDDSALAGYRAAIEGRFEDAYAHLIRIERDGAAVQHNLSIIRWALEKYTDIPSHPPPSLNKKDRRFLLDLGREASRRAGANRTRCKEQGEDNFARGLRLHEVSRFAESATRFARVLDAEPSNWRAWNNRADQLMRLRLLDHALICALIAVVANPHDGVSFCTLGEIMAKLEKDREALACFEVAARRVSNPKELSYLKREVSALNARAKL
jgi:tetratricopeptide (TPR) repeat protein